MTLDGALVGAVGDAVDHKVVGAIAAHTWGELAHAGRECNADHALQTLLVELDVRGGCCLAFGGSGGFSRRVCAAREPGDGSCWQGLPRVCVLKRRRGARAHQGEGARRREGERGYIEASSY